MMKTQTKRLLILISVAVLLVGIVVATLLIGSGEEQPEVSYTEGEGGYLSPSSVAVIGHEAFVTNATGNTLHKVDLQSGAVTGTGSFSQNTNAVYADGGTLYLLAGGLAGDLMKVSTNMEVLARVDAGHTPVAMAADETRLYVANRFSGDLCVYLKSTMALEKTVPVGREPMAVEIAGGKVYVACHLTENASNAALVSAKIAVYDPSDGEVKDIPLPNGATGVKDLAVSPDGGRLYCTMVISRYGYPTTQLQEGWVNTNALGIVDLTSDTLVCAVLLDDGDRGAANPYAVEAANGRIAVTIAGLGEVMVIDEAEMLARVNASADPAGIVNDLNFLAGAKRRLPLQGRGCRAAKLYGGELLVCDYFSASLERCPLDGSATTTVLLGNSAAPGNGRIGEIIWNDASLCYGGWESCASCHPEGRCDGQAWDEAGDGYGTPKNTKSMIFAHRTPPSLATGLAGPAENNVYESIRGVYCNADMTDEQIACVDVYLRSILPTQSPFLTREGTLTASAKRGKTLFQSKGCASCHTGPYLTDMQDHLSPTLELDDGGETRPFNTPTLVELWRSAPYFFNGQMTTMAQVVSYYDETYSLSLSESEKEDLTAYLLSVGTEGESYAVEEVFFEKDGESAIVKPLSEGILKEITVRKQQSTAKSAYLRFTLTDKDGRTVLQSAEVEIDGAMKVGDYATVRLDLQLPELEDGMTYTVSLLNNKGAALATLYTYTYHA